MKDTLDIDPSFNEHDMIARSGSDQISHVISSAFEKHDDLIYCAVEHVTLGNVNGVGVTHYYHHHAQYDRLGLFIEEYLAVVDYMDEWREGSISSFRNWYNRDRSYLLIGQNEGPIPTLVSTDGSWRKHVRPPSERKPNPFKADQCFTPRYIEEYLTEYVSQLRKSTSWFRQAPHFCIIVKPISVRDSSTDDGDFLPLGNLYLHFGMQKVKDDSRFFFHEIVNQLIQVWFRTNGYQIAKNIAQGIGEILPPSLLTEHLSPQGLIPSRRRKLSGPIHLDKHNKTWNEFYNKAFSVNSNSRLLNPENKLILLKSLTQGYEEYGKDPATFLKNRLVGVIGTEIEYGFTLGNCKNIDDEALKRFVRTLNLRRCCLILQLVIAKTQVRMDPTEIHALLVSKVKQTKSDANAAHLYLDRMFLIPLNDEQAQITLSPSEKTLVQGLERFLSDPSTANH